MGALLSVSYGTSHVEARKKTIDVMDAELRKAFPDREFYSAWTSNHIIEKVRAERGELHDTLADAIARIEASGTDDLAVATSCLMRGSEMAKVEAAVSEWGAKGGRSACVARPLLASSADRRQVADMLGTLFADIPDEDALLLMGHGSKSGPDNTFSDLQRALRDSGRKRFFVACVEGEPTFERALLSILKAAPARVHLAPLMFVAGGHAKNDMLGDDPDSWNSRLETAGIEVVPIMRGLGEYFEVRDFVCDHLRDALIMQEIAMRG